MLRIRYVGDADVVDLTVPGGTITCPRGEWIDPVEQMDAMHVPLEHLAIVARDLGPHFEIDGDATELMPPASTPRKRTRKRTTRARRPATPPADTEENQP